MLEALYAEHGELRERISDADGGLRRFVNVYLRGEDIRFLDGLDTEVGEGDEVTILPAVAGGARSPQRARREVVGPDEVERERGRRQAASASMPPDTERS